jgi:hypothetical protein
MNLILLPQITLETKNKIITNENEIIEDDIYFVIGDYFDNLTDEIIETLYNDFINTNALCMSPKIIHKNKLEYFGCFSYIINENIITLDKTNLKYPFFSYIQNTFLPYPNFYIIKNKNNIIKNIFNQNDFINYSIYLKNVKINPFICLNSSMHVKFKYIDFPKYMDKTFLVDLYNKTYLKHNLVSFKFFENQYYLTNNTNKTILIIESTILTPDKDCGSLYILSLIKTFIRMGFNIHFITSNMYYDSVYTTNLQRLGVYVVYNFPHSVLTHIKNNSNVYDYIFVCRNEILKIYIDNIKIQCPKSKIIYITHDLYFLRIAKDNPYLLEKLKNEEIELIKKTDYAVVVSIKELELLKHIHNVVYIPICYELRKNYNRNIEKTKDIYFIGSLHPPNLDAISYFLDNYWESIEKLLKIKIHIIGGGYDEIKKKYKNNKNIIFHGYLNDYDMESRILKCRINIAPLRIGAGIKGKILQSLNLKVPTVCSTIAISGMKIKNNINAVVLDYDEKYVENFVNTYNNIELLKKISDYGYKTFKKYYSLEKNEEYFKKILF